MILYEPAQALSLGGAFCGSDGISLRYPSVNTCLTLTHVYPACLVGAHFGLLEPGDPPAYVSYGRVYSMLGLMDGMAPRGVAPTHTLLIGNVGLWRQGDTRAKYNIINAHHPVSFYKETEDFSGGTVDIEVFMKGLVTIRATNGGQVETLTFTGGNALGSLSYAARGRLGL
jgi:hypothetical protein